MPNNETLRTFIDDGKREAAQKEAAQYLDAVVSATEPDERDADQLPMTADEQARYVSGFMGLQTGPVWSSFDKSKPAGRVATFNAVSACNERLVDALNRKLDLVGLVVHARRCTTKEGELLEGVRLVLCCADGTTYYTSGAVPRNSIGALIVCMDLPPWSPAIPVTVERWKSQTEGHYSVQLRIDQAEYDRRCALPPAEKQTTKGGKP